MNMRLLKDGLQWGAILWFVGYVLGFLFYAFVPVSLIGWLITPIGVAVTVWVLLKFIKGNSLPYYAALGGMWALSAIILDYFFLVLLLKPADGYYKLDVYLYYVLTFALPIIVFWLKKRKSNTG